MALTEDTLHRQSAGMYLPGVGGFDLQFDPTASILLEFKVNQVMVEIALKGLVVCDTNKLQSSQSFPDRPVIAMQHATIKSRISKSSLAAMENASIEVS